MDKDPKKEISEGFIPVPLEELLVETQFLAHEHFPQKNRVGIEDTLGHAAKEDGHNLADMVGLLPLVVRMDPVLENVYHGMVDFTFSDSDINRFVLFSQEFLSNIIGRLGYCSMIDKSKERLGGVVKNMMERVSVEKGEEQHSLRIIYLFGPSMSVIFISDGRDDTLGNRIPQEYSLRELHRSSVNRNATYAQIVDMLDGRIRDGCKRTDAKVDDSARIGSVISQLKSCLQRSDNSYPTDFEEASRHLLEFLKRYDTVQKQKPLELSEGNRALMNELYSCVFGLASIYATMASLDGTRRTIEYGKGKPLTQEEIKMLKKCSEGLIDFSTLGELEAGRDLTDEERKKYNPRILDKEAIGIKARIKSIMGEIDSKFGSEKEYHRKNDYRPAAQREIELPGGGVMLHRVHGD